MAPAVPARGGGSRGELSLDPKPLIRGPQPISDGDDDNAGCEGGVDASGQLMRLTLNTPARVWSENKIGSRLLPGVAIRISSAEAKRLAILKLECARRLVFLHLHAF